MARKSVLAEAIVAVAGDGPWDTIITANALRKLAETDRSYRFDEASGRLFRKVYIDVCVDCGCLHPEDKPCYSYSAGVLAWR